MVYSGASGVSELAGPSECRFTLPEIPDASHVPLHRCPSISCRFPLDAVSVGGHGEQRPGMPRSRGPLAGSRKTLATRGALHRGHLECHIQGEMLQCELAKSPLSPCPNAWRAHAIIRLCIHFCVSSDVGTFCFLCARTAGPCFYSDLSIIFL